MNRKANVCPSTDDGGRRPSAGSSLIAEDRAVRRVSDDAVTSRRVVIDELFDAVGAGVVRHDARQAQLQIELAALGPTRRRHRPQRAVQDLSGG